MDFSVDMVYSSESNMKKSPFLILLAALLTGCLTQKTDTSPVLARFDGTVITQDQLRKKLAALPNDLRSVMSQRKKEFVEELVSEHFLLKEAVRRGIDRIAEVQDLIEAARKKIIVAKLVENEVDKKVAVDPKNVERYYESHKEEFTTPLLVRASHILVKTEPEAAAIKQELDQGADFEEIARHRSLDATAIRGGDLGFSQKGRFVPEFEEAVYQLKKGQISDPVKTQFGFHIIKLTDVSEPGIRDFRAVKRLVEERLFRERRSQLFKQLMEKLRGNAKIDIDEKALEKI